MGLLSGWLDPEEILCESVRESMKLLSPFLTRFENDTREIELLLDNTFEQTNSEHGFSDHTKTDNIRMFMDRIQNHSEELERIRDAIYICEDQMHTLEASMDDEMPSIEETCLTKQKMMRDLQTELSQLLNRIEVEEERQPNLMKKLFKLGKIPQELLSDVHNPQPSDSIQSNLAQPRKPRFTVHFDSAESGKDQPASAHEANVGSAQSDSAKPRKGRFTVQLCSPESDKARIVSAHEAFCASVQAPSHVASTSINKWPAAPPVPPPPPQTPLLSANFYPTWPPSPAEFGGYSHFPPPPPPPPLVVGKPEGYRWDEQPWAARHRDLLQRMSSFNFNDNYNSK